MFLEINCLDLLLGNKTFYGYSILKINDENTNYAINNLLEEVKNLKFDVSDISQSFLTVIFLKSIVERLNEKQYKINWEIGSVKVKIMDSEIITVH